MDEVLVRAVTWVVRGAGLAVDLLLLGGDIQELRRRKARENGR
ncbi:hypothetical protein [Streptomyces sp. R44]|uniref:Uncharacterized protein n=1 Tax=Streptomyces sp. R44 TaxID=3238633 RepID=A0AB39T0P1_9ACTN